MRSSMEVNCENTIVFSPSPRSSISSRISMILRNLAEVDSPSTRIALSMAQSLQKRSRSSSSSSSLSPSFRRGSLGNNLVNDQPGVRCR